MNARKTASAKTRGPVTRPLTAGDLDAVVSIDTAVNGRARRGYHERRLAAAKRAPALHAQYAVEEGGRFTGYVLGKVLEGEFGRTQPAVRLEVIAVSPDSQGHGDGVALCEALEAEARRRGIRELRTGASWRDSRMLRFLDHAGWSRALLVGHSMGGRSTTWLAAKHPERVAGLALIDYSPENAPAGSKRVTQIVAHTPERFASIEEAMKYFNSTNRERFENYLTADLRLKRDPYFRDQFKRLLETGERPKLGVDMWQLLGEVRCPILSMRGSRSDMYAAETTAKMKAANPRLALVEVDAGHNIAGENPQGFVAALRPFLALLEESHAHERH